MSSKNPIAPAEAMFVPDQVREYKLLTRRWKKLIKGIPFLQLRIFGEASGYPLMVVESKSRTPGALSFYVSTGIHGDEPAGVEGLLQWAGEHLSKYRGWNIQLFPCLNPWGLENNIRCDFEGRDLNRCYNLRKIPQIIAQRAAMKGHRYHLALMLHEDYDARGFYLYETQSLRPFWGESLRDDLAKFMQPDPRRVIDERPARNGVIRRRIDKVLLEQLSGHPEALHLYFHHADRTFTFETPSEEFLGHRVKLHKKFLELALTRLSSPKFSQIAS